MRSFEILCEGKATTKDQAIEYFLQDKKLKIKYIRGEMEETSYEEIESFDGTYLVRSRLTFRDRKYLNNEN